MSARQKLDSVVRDWRERDVRVVLSALVIAVATVAVIALFAGQLQRTLVTSASSFLAADRQLEAEHGEPIPGAWRDQAKALGLRTARMVEFPTMIAGGDRFQLVSVKAVSDGYPLRGEIEFQATMDNERKLVSKGPAKGEAWLSPRLMRLLELGVGDPVGIGDLELAVTGLLIREPDGGFNLGGLAPRVMIHTDDVAATGVIQEGSRVEYINLFAGDESALNEFHTWLEPRLEPSHEWESIEDGEALSESLQRAERFLLLGGSIAVLLAAVAVAVASRQYAVGQRDTVALLKTLGLPSQRIGRMYLTRLAVWGVFGMLGGLVAALPIYVFLTNLTAEVLDRDVPLTFDAGALVPALATAVVSLFAFAYPPIRRLRQVPAMRVLRSQPGEVDSRAWLDVIIAVVGVFGLVWLYAREVVLVFALIGGLVALLGTLAFAGWLMVMVLRRVSGGGNAWRLALVGLYRHRRASLSQIAVFAMTLMLATVLILVRSSLLEDWQAQLPDEAPNHFLINIAPDAVDDVEAFWQNRGRRLDALYPMVRGRLTEIDGEPVRQVVSKDENVNALNRELNLTWMESPPEDNRIVAGQWFGEGQTHGVSVEAELASRLGVEVGDVLGFTVGSKTISEPVTSIRTVQWESMKPNFYMAFPPGGALESMPATWITSFYLPQEQKSALNDFSRQFPTVSLLEVDHIIARIQAIVGQVTQAIEAILALILAASLVVMAAVVSATLQDRQREGALLRTLGGRQSLLVRSTMLEFGLAGVLAGLLGIAAAETAVWALQYRMFGGEFRWHWAVVFPIPLVSGLVLALLGRWQLQPVLRVSPMLLLRRLE